MIYLLCGKSGAGKSTVAQCLHDLFGVYRINTYTTRQKRDGERENFDYHFVSDDAFKNLEKHHEFIESRSYNASFGCVSYGSLRKDYYPSNLYPKRVIILNPDGILSLKDAGVFDKKSVFDDVLVIYLDIDADVLLERLQKRGDSPQEIQRRLQSDEIDFKKLERFDTLYKIDCTKMNPIDICKKIINLR